MIIRPLTDEQNSAYRTTLLSTPSGPCPEGVFTATPLACGGTGLLVFRHHGPEGHRRIMPDSHQTHARKQLYPKDWENQAEIRVLRAKPGEWEKLAGWRSDMSRRGWQLLRVHSDTQELVAVFGKTRRPSSNS